VVVGQPSEGIPVRLFFEIHGTPISFGDNPVEVDSED
jgi:hypothetical protein